MFAGEKTITLTDAWQSAISTYETLMLSQEDVYQSEKGIDKAISQILPTLTADANYTKYSESKKNLQPDNSTSYDIKLSQSLYSGGKEWSLWRQAKKKTESSKHSLEATREGIMLNVSQAYYLVLKAEKIVDIKEASLRRVKEQRRVATTRFQVGEVTKAIVL
ncbi:MAG: TolC family protein, partial [Deltaproteobacteria bacterium]|nr:TolC family protein [Deltaproteobacteria bacterium]